VIGKKDSGKTTLLVALAAEYTRKGRRVMTIKHSSHPASADQPGTDSHRHFHEGKAERTLLVSPDTRISFERRADATDPITLAREYLSGADIVLVEGFASAPLPKIEVFRREASKTPLFVPDAPDAAEWVAIVTDDEHFEATCPVLRFRDTMWMQLLANLGWDRAKVI
jgi:molybdopterin-guanine dinucleotide biosynthesis protein B